MTNSRTNQERDEILKNLLEMPPDPKKKKPEIKIGKKRKKGKRKTQDIGSR